MINVFYLFFFSWSGSHRDLTGLTHSFPTRRSSDLGSVVADGAIWACATEGARAAPMTSAAVPLRSHPADEPRRRSGCVVQLLIAYANTLPRRLIAFPHLLLRQGVLNGES